MSNNIITFERAFVKFSDDLAVDGYRSPSGEFRVGMAGASVVLGYEKSWVSQLVSGRIKMAKSLLDNGFTNCMLKGKVLRDRVSGSSVVQTISLDDFNILVVYAAGQGKKNAMALNLALSRTTLQNLFLIAFENRVMSVQETTKFFSDDFIKTIDWLGEDQKDAEAILNHLRFLGELPYDDN
jgi:hypothetical protein